MSRLIANLFLNSNTRANLISELQEFLTVLIAIFDNHVLFVLRRLMRGKAQLCTIAGPRAKSMIVYLKKLYGGRSPTFGRRRLANPDFGPLQVKIRNPISSQFIFLKKIERERIQILATADTSREGGTRPIFVSICLKRVNEGRNSNLHHRS